MKILKLIAPILILTCVGIFFISDDTQNIVLENKVVKNILSKDFGFNFHSKFEEILSTLPGPLKKIVGDGEVPASLSASLIINATNAARMQNGNLPALATNPELSASSESKVDDMFIGQYFEHVSPSGISVAELTTTAGYEYIVVGENLALGNFLTEQAIVDAWMASPGHRANILNDRYTEIGVSVKKGIYEGQEVFIAVQHFGLPLSTCPEINTGLKNTITELEKEVADLEVELASQKAQIDAEEGNAKKEIEAYNETVDIYNKTIAVLKIQIAAYNSSVTAFNACLAG